jgi:prevent-host-death family protein
MVPISMTVSDAKEELSELVNRVSSQQERVILTRRGTPLAALVPISDFQQLQALQDQVDVDEALNALEEAREKGFLSLDVLNQKQSQS